MKIMMLSGIAPTENNPMAGIFIYNRAKIYAQYADIIYSTPASIINTGLAQNKSYEYNNFTINKYGYLKLFHDPNPINNFFYKKSFERLLKVVKPNVIVCHNLNIGFNSLDIAKKLNIKFVQFYHGSDIHTLAKQKVIYKKMAMYLLENSDGNIFVSNNLLKNAYDITRNINNYYITSNGIDTDIFKKYDKDKLLNLLPNINMRNNYIYGFVGHFKWIKGVDLFPKIIEILKQRIDISKCFFLFIGRGELKQLLEEKLNNLNIKFVILPPMKQDKLALYLNIIDTLMIPSRNEGFPCLVREGLSCGCNIVASNVGGIPEAIDKENSILINQDNQFIINFSEALYENYIANKKNRNDVFSNHSYSWEVISTKEIEYIKKLVND